MAVKSDRNTQGNIRIKNSHSSRKGTLLPFSSDSNNVAKNDFKLSNTDEKETSLFHPRMWALQRLLQGHSAKIKNRLSESSGSSSSSIAHLSRGIEVECGNDKMMMMTIKKTSEIGHK